MVFRLYHFVKATHFLYNFVVNELFCFIILSHRFRLFPYKFVTGNRFAFIILS